MLAPRRIGILGAVLTIVGVFLPIGVSPLHGSTSLLGNPISIASGVILIVVSLASVVFSLVGKENKLLTTAMMAIFIVLTSFMSFSGQVAKAQDDPKLASQLVGVQLGLAWPVLGLGALLLLMAAMLARRRVKLEE
jgi:hypothetical protein